MYAHREKLHWQKVTWCTPQGCGASALEYIHSCPDICLWFMFIKGIAFIQVAGRLAFTNYIKFVCVYMQDSGDKRLLLSKLSSFVI